MDYLTFNQRILEFYIGRCNTSTITLEIEEIEINERGFNEIPKLDFRSDWSKFNKSIQSVPQYFGLIAIQCYAASLMEKDDFGGHNNYQVRLNGIIGISIQKLQALFKGKDVKNPIQEKIWYSAKEYLSNIHGLTLEIPEKRISGKYRHVQYPKSQCLLKIEDLKHFTSFFSEYFRIGEEISFSNFKTILEKEINFINLSDRANFLLEQTETKSKCFYQIYNYFTSWNGEVFNYINNQKRTTLKNTNTSSSIFLIFENGLPLLYINQENIKTSDIFMISNYNYFYKNILLFNQSEYYPNEFEDSRFLYYGNECFILLEKQFRPNEFNKLSYLCETHNVIQLSINLVLFKLEINENVKWQLGKFVLNDNPFKLFGGIRLSRKREYLFGFGPLVKSESIKYFKNNLSTEYNCQTSTSGEYKIKIPGQKDIKFTILEANDLGSNIERKSVGWNLKKYVLDDNDIDIEGLNLIESQIQENRRIRKWIEEQIRSKNRVRNSNTLNKLNRIMYYGNI